MIKEFLKIAGVKNEKQFYNKYPSEAAFFKAHPEAKHLKSFKKGGEMKKLEQLTDFGNPTAKEGKKVPKYQLAPAPVPNASGPYSGYNNVNDWTNSLWNPNAPSAEAANTAQTIIPPYSADYKGPLDPNAVKAFDPNAKAPSRFDKILGKLGGPMGVASLATGMIGGVRGLQDEKKSLEEAQTAEKVSGLTLQATRSKSKDPLRRYYNRPEDQIINPDELFPTYGVGSNVLSSAQDGATIGGNPTEIQNTYNPGTLYSELGYEPLNESSFNESSIVKQYVHGGGVPRAAGGFMGVLGDIAGSSFGQQIPGLFSELGSGGAPNAGSNLGQTLGTAAGTIFGGPVGSMIGGALGGLVGGALDPRAREAMAAQKRTQNILQRAGFESGAQAFAQSTGAAKNGTSLDSDYEWISHTWQPQVITKFGDVDVSQIHSIATEGMDTLRTGGRITQNNIYPQDQYALGGNLKTTWGGYAEPMSYNKHLPGTGEIAMFKGLNGKVGAHSQHAGNGHTGIGVVYGDGGELTDYAEFGSKNAPAKVEVEKGEPVVELEDTSPESMISKLASGGEQSGDNLSMNVFGDLTVSNQVSPKYAGRKYKHVVRDLGIDTEKINKQMVNLKNKISNIDITNPFGLIEAQTLKKIHDAKDNELKMIADDIKNLAIGQNATNETAEEYGIDANALAKGKIKIDKEAMKQQAKLGKMIKKAQTGTEETLSGVSALGYVPAGQTKDPSGMYGGVTAAQFEELKKANKWYDFTGFDPSDEADVKHFQKKFNEKAASVGSPVRINPDGRLGQQTISAATSWQKPTPPPVPIKTSDDKKETPPTVTPTTTKKPNWWDAIGSVIPSLQRPYQMGFDAAQLYPEMMALSMNVLEPVKAQGVQPLLETPYDISLQDQLNEITAGERAAQKMVMGDPSAMANIAAQSQAAKQKVLGEQFRANQAMKAGVYGRNRQALNQAQLQNLQIYADQEQKQQMAKANTKATALAAMESMSDKIAKNKLENRTLAAMQNFFPNYRITPGMQITPSGITILPTPIVGSGAKPTSTSETTASAKKGKLLKKSNFNGSIVKALKNI